MKKILKTFLILSIITPLTSNVIACNKDKEPIENFNVSFKSIKFSNPGHGFAFKFNTRNIIVNKTDIVTSSDLPSDFWNHYYQPEMANFYITGGNNELWDKIANVYAINRTSSDNDIEQNLKKEIANVNITFRGEHWEFGWVITNFSIASNI